MRIGVRQILSLHQQRARMILCHRQFHCSIFRRDGRPILACRGIVSPSPLCSSYHARIEYGLASRPHVWIDQPKLARRKLDERIPHTFKDDRPCLYFDEFKSTMALAKTIVPWLHCWLLFYECWLVTGVWQGGGIHPGTQD